MDCIDLCFSAIDQLGLIGDALVKWRTAEFLLMSFSVFVKMCDDQFMASLVGAPNVRVTAPTRSQAIDALKAEIQQRMGLGELVSLEVDTIGVSSMAGKYRTDPTLREICDNAYQIRNAE